MWVAIYTYMCTWGATWGRTIRCYFLHGDFVLLYRKQAVKPYIWETLENGFKMGDITERYHVHVCMHTRDRKY